MQNTAATPQVVRVRKIATRKARVVLAATVVAAALVVPPLVAGLVAPPAHAATRKHHRERFREHCPLKCS